MAELLLNGKKLEDLKVSELKDELDRRDLSKKGNKSSLLERLRKAVLEEVVAGSATSVADDSAELDTSEVESIGDKELVKRCKVEVRVEHLMIKDTAPSANEQTEDTVTSGGEQSSQQEKEVVIPKKSAPGRKPGGKKRGRGGRMTSPRCVDVQPKLEDDSGLSLEDSNSIKLEANLESKTEPLEPISESVPCELFTADSDMKENTAGEEDVKPMEEEKDATDMGVPLHVEEGAMDFDIQEKLETSQDLIKFDDDDVNLAPEPVVDDLDQKQQYNEEKQEYTDEASSQEEMSAKDDTIEDENTSQLNEEEPSKAEGSSSLTNSATIDPSYAPENEELLYEGDVENDHTDDKEGTPVMDETTAEENREQDLSLVLDLHVSGEMEDLQTKDDDQAAKSGEGAGQADKSTQCSLWVSGLGSTVSASDLKTLFSPFGSVSSAKVVAKPGSQSRFGFVTMRQEKEAAKCIEELNGKELKGSSISVELAKGGSALVGKSKAAKDSTGDKKTSDRSVSQDPKKPSDGKSSSSSGSSKNSKGASDKSSSRKESSSSHHHRSSSKHSPSHHSPSRGSKDRRKRSRSPQSSSASKTGRPAVRGELQRNLEMRLEPRLPEREIYLRRQLTLEQQEKDLMERIQAIREREIREREIRQQALAEQERIFRQKERELKERELRERRRREELERVLRQGDARERDFRERERRLKEEFQRQLREQEMKAKHERQMRERDLLVQAQKEEQLREQERKLQETKQQYFKLNKEKEILAARAAKAEQEKLERERQLHDIQQRERRERELLEKRLLKEKAEQERMFLDKQKELEERAHQQQQEFKRREMERMEVEKREWERERQHSLEVAKKEVGSSVESSRERDKHEHKSSKSSDRGTKRPFSEDTLFDEVKRPIRHDIRDTLSSFHQSVMQQEGRGIRRDSPPRGYDRSRGQEPVGYPAPSGRGPGYGDRPTPTSRSAGLPVTPNLPPELINAANKALQTIQRAANAAIPDQHRQSRPMPNSGGRPYGGGGPLPTGRPDPYLPRPGFQGSQMGGGYPPSQARMHDDRGRRVSSGGPAPYQGGYGRRY